MWFTWITKVMPFFGRKFRKANIIKILQNPPRASTVNVLMNVLFIFDGDNFLSKTGLHCCWKPIFFFTVEYSMNVFHEIMCFKLFLMRYLLHYMGYYNLCNLTFTREMFCAFYFLWFCPTQLNPCAHPCLLT